MTNTRSLGPYCETLFFHTFWISNWNFKHFKCICILCFIMSLKYFPIETRFTCAKSFFNPIKIKANPTLWYCILTLELEFILIFILFVSVIFKSFRQSTTTCVYNPFYIAIRFVLFLTSIGILWASFALLLQCFIKSSGKCQFHKKTLVV